MQKYSLELIEKHKSECMLGNRKNRVIIDDTEYSVFQCPTTLLSLNDALIVLFTISLL